MARILLIDDDDVFTDALGGVLRGRSHDVTALDSAEEGLKVLAADGRFDLVLLDQRMPRMSGLEFLAAASAQGVRVSVILMTSAHDDSTAIQAIKRGAFAYVLKAEPRDMLPELEPVLAEAIEIVRRPAPVPLNHGPAIEEADTSVLVGRSKPMLKLLGEIARVAQGDETALLLGETGTGKDLVAQAIHTNSGRDKGPFVFMNCAALNDNLFESELFGHEIGAFTGATKVRKGRFEHADGGTLFLDEVGDMPLGLQVKLLRVLEDRTITRMGSNDPLRVNVRVLAATHRNLGKLVEQGKFREDLLYRLDDMTIRLPPLREREGDHERLARVFLARMFADRGARPVLHPEALRRLQEYRWPGNVRQFQKVLGRAARACRGGQILPEDVDFGSADFKEPVAPDAQAALRAVVEAAWRNHPADDLWAHLQEQLQRELLARALDQPDFSEVKFARRLGVSRNLVRKWREQFGLIEPPGEPLSA